MATGNLRLIQMANNALLRRFKKICDMAGAHFFLHGGTLVGALRHSGFVPWDDDIDIAMMRDDFNKVKLYLAAEQIPYEIKEFYYIGLACRSYRFIRMDCAANCFVDIFVYDSYTIQTGSVYGDWRKLCEKKLEMRRCLPQLCKKLNSFPQEPALLGFPELKKALDEEFERIIQENTSTDENADFILWNLDNNYEDETHFAWNHGRIFAKSDIFPFETADFEGETYCVPKNWSEYTFAEYGIQYDDIAANFGQSIHVAQYFNTEEQLDLAKKLIALEETNV